MEKKPKNKWLLPFAITLAFLAMAATGFLMGHPPKAVDSMLQKTLKRADDLQDRDAMSVRLPRLGGSSAPAASK